MPDPSGSPTFSVVDYFSLTTLDVGVFIDFSFYKAKGSLQKWKPQILTTLKLREEGISITNAYAEGMNNQIATLIKIHMD